MYMKMVMQGQHLSLSRVMCYTGKSSSIDFLWGFHLVYDNKNVAQPFLNYCFLIEKNASTVVQWNKQHPVHYFEMLQIC